MPGSQSRRSGKRLSAAMVRSSLKPGKYHDGGGTGLYLRVDESGGRFWIQRIMIRGKRREMGLGGANIVTLAEAREEALENKRLARKGGDPIAERRKAKTVLTFEEAARRTHEELAPTFKNPKDQKAFLTTLERHIFPRFGQVSVAEITSADVRQAILDIRKTRPEAARKLTYRIAAVCRWAIAEGMRTDNPATPDALALPRLDRKPDHRKALHYSEVSGCIEAVKASGANPATKLALEFLVLTAARSGEVRGMTWDEVDMEGAEWEIPAERMKMKRPHRVPLSTRALDVLREAMALSGGVGLVFPGVKRGRPMSDMTLSKLVRELGFDAHVHGFRTSFRTWAQEQTNFPREVAEAALAHVVKDKAEAAYARSDLFEKRRKMMESWAGYLSLESASPKVISLN